MKVFKFGGASVKDEASVKNVCDIIQHFKKDDVVVVISAMGKTTNKLEMIIESYLNNNTNKEKLLEELIKDHFQIVQSLFNKNDGQIISEKIKLVFEQCKNNLTSYKNSTYNFIYDQVICTGELISTIIVHAYLKSKDMAVEWLDARKIIKTDNTYREAAIDWEKTNLKIQEHFDNKQGITVTQGFIGSDDNLFTTTLGREGSDFTAAIFANILNAKTLQIWKDVDGILSADPKLYPDATLIPSLTYNDAIEMTYYGAKVIHPKTIKPLQNKNIPLIVRPFTDIAKQGTCISKNAGKEASPPVIILKDNQVLLKVISKDFSFIAEKNLSHLLKLFSKHLVKINLFQTAAIKVYACVNQNPQKIPALIDDLQLHYEVSVMESLKVLTIRNYTDEAIQKYAADMPKIMEQKSKNTVQFVLSDGDV